MPREFQWSESKFRISRGVVRASRNAAELSRSSRILADMVGEFYTRSIPEWANGDLIDLGCGKAPLLGAYREYCTSHVLADWENSEHPNRLLDLSFDLNQPLSVIDSKTFDTVLLSDVLEHVREPKALVFEIARILRPGGALLLNVPFAYWIHEAPHDYYRYTRYALEGFIQEAGLDLIELRPLGGWPAVLADLFSKVLNKFRMYLLVSIIHSIFINLNKSSLGRRLVSAGSDRMPLGYALVAVKRGESDSALYKY